MHMLMLDARRYELHNEKVIKYFVSKYGENVDDHLLIVDLSDTKLNHWEKIMNFLQCGSFHNDSNINIYKSYGFPQTNRAPADQIEAMLPRNITFDWKNYAFRNKFVRVMDIGEKYYQEPLSMGHRYFNSYDDVDYVNLYQDIYKKIAINS